MKRLNFTKLNNLSLLHDELLAAIPALRPVPNGQGRIDSDGNIALEAVMGVEGTDNELWLTVPDTADEAAISTVVQAHDSTVVVSSPRDQRRQRIQELLAVGRSNWTASQRNELLELLSLELA